MAQVKFHKFVAALPAELEADAIYYVRAGAGFDIYVTNSSGVVVAYPLNVAAPGQSFFRTEAVTATAAGQASFTVPGGYTPGAIIVSLNGSTLTPADYVATDGSTVVLATGTGIVAGSVLLVYVLSAFEVADALPLGGTAADSNMLGGTLAAEFYRRSNILGTVSQSGGVPTGAIIERGSNANGEYTKYADGKLVCRLRDRTGATGTKQFTLPHVYANDNIQASVLITSSSSAAITAKRAGNSTSSYGLVFIQTTSSATGYLTVDIVADIVFEGVWF